MTSDPLKQDFESALVKHFAFKARLRSFLYGNGTSEGPLRNPDECSLGQWIAGRWHGPYRAVPEMRELDQLHRRIHEQANQLMDWYQAGQVARAQAGFADVQRTADHVVQLLQTIEARVRTAGVQA